MWYVILGEAIVVAVLWGAWLHKKALLKAADTDLLATRHLYLELLEGVKALSARHEEEVEHLKTELVETRKTLDALSTPDAVRSDINRLFTR